jgi:hypothetical protein
MKWEVIWLNQNGGGSQGSCLHNPLGMQDIDAPCDTADMQKCE